VVAEALGVAAEAAAVALVATLAAVAAGMLGAEAAAAAAAAEAAAVMVAGPKLQGRCQHQRRNPHEAKEQVQSTLPLDLCRGGLDGQEWVRDLDRVQDQCPLRCRAGSAEELSKETALTGGALLAVGES